MSNSTLDILNPKGVKKLRLYLSYLKGAIILAAIIASIVFIIVKFWKVVAIVCSLSLIGFIFLSYENLTKP